MLKIKLKDGVSKSFFEAMRSQYPYFLAKYSYGNIGEATVYINDEKAGFCILNKRNEMRIAKMNIPESAGQAANIVRKFIDRYNVKEFGLECKIENYPALKSLYQIGGGILTPNHNERYAWGLAGDITEKNPIYKKNIERLLPVSKILFKQWLETGKPDYSILKMCDFNIANNQHTKSHIEQSNIAEIISGAILKHYNLNSNVFFAKLETLMAGCILRHNEHYVSKRMKDNNPNEFDYYKKHRITLFINEIKYSAGFTERFLAANEFNHNLNKFELNIRRLN